MVGRRLYKCQKCSMIYWGHELIPGVNSYPAMIQVRCPTPGCPGREFFGQGTPGETGAIHALMMFLLALAILRWGFGVEWLWTLGLSFAASVTVWLGSRRLHRPGSPTEDVQYAANQTARRAEALHKREWREQARYAYERAITLLGGGVDLKLEAAIVGRLANVERELGDFAAARAHYERALQIAEQIGDVSGRINRHNNIAVLLGDDLGDPVAAIEHVQMALSLARSINDSGRVSRMLTHLAKRQREARRLDEAEASVEEALGISRSTGSRELAAEALHERGCLRMVQGRNEEAQSVLKEARGLVNPRTQATLAQHIKSNLSTLREAIRDGATIAIGRPGEESDMDEVSLGLDPEAAKELRVGFEHMAAPRIKLAIEAFQRALETGPVQSDPKARALARSNLGNMLRDMGRNTDAEEVLRQGLVDVDEAGIAQLERMIRLNLGLVLHVKGAWAEARACLERALALSDQQRGRTRGRILLALGNLRRDTTDYSAAAGDYVQAEQIARDCGDRELEGAVSQSLGSLHFKQRQWEESRPYYEKAKTIAEETKDPSLQGMAVHMLGNTLRRLGQSEEAHELLLRSVSMADLCPTDVGKAGRLNDLGVVEQDLGRFVDARKHFQQSVDMYHELGLTSPEIAGCYQNLGVSLIRCNDVRDGRDWVLQAAEMDNEMIAQAFAIASEEARLEFLEQARRRLDDVVSLVARGGPCEGERSTVAACADIVIRRKGASLEALAAQRDLAASGRYPDLAVALREMNQVRMSLAQLTLAGKALRGGRYTAEAAALVDRRRQLEQEIARAVPSIELDRRLRRSDRHAVALALPEGCVLVEFVRFGFFPYPPTDQPPLLGPHRYAAFVVAADSPDAIQMIDLGDAQPIDTMIADFRDSILGEGERRDLGTVAADLPTSAVNGAGNSLRMAVFDPFLQAIGRRTRMILAPDGDLTRLPFEVLPDGDGKLLIDEYQFSYVTVGREVLRFGAQHAGQSSDPIVMADPDFDLASNGVHEAECKPPGEISRDLSRERGCHFERLPGTRVEGEHVSDMLKVKPWLGADALEARLKACRSPRILHLATHGFFLEDQSRDANGDPRGLAMQGGLVSSSGEFLAARIENPLLRSGLALSGVNTWFTNRPLPPEAEDGILTAEDVTGLDLLDTDLVVLSACETGLGRIRIGEGVFGLRRAVVLAGARTLVMSLWKVPDHQSQELMEDFYQRILADESRVEALRQAQLTLKAKYPDPFYWGAFICQGEPGPLMERGCCGSAG